VLYPESVTSAEKASRSCRRVEIYQVTGGTEYIVHDIDENNVIVGKAKISSNVKLPESMSVVGFGSSDNLAVSNERDVKSVHDGTSAVGAKITLPPTFYPPSFGVTVLGNSHGFDAKGSVSGYVLWVNGRGIMIDPPTYSSATLEREGIRPRTIVGVILTHCHADHDAGAFQKILTGSPVVVITTPTIYKSFIRKYSALSELSEGILQRSHRFKPAIIGAPLRFQGATFHFIYTLHSIPCVGFRVEWRGRSMVFTGDHFNDPDAIEKLVDNVSTFMYLCSKYS
jgi:glyoxylase-like metal-dependent hydrolase (beta-lactamase superfamily II)